ncbi:MAG: discoidin domain-containing protein [Bryobacteraceae bacterium]
MNRILLLTLLAASILNAQPYTRGIGVYPGDPSQDFAPTLVPDTTTYRNLALHRPAYQSSAYDYNLTAQLVTDGIKETSLPRWLSTSTSQQGVLKKNQRELMLDHNPVSTVELRGTNAWVQFELAGGDSPLEVDRITVEARTQAEGWTCAVTASDDAQQWNELGRDSGKCAVQFPAPAHARFYRVEFDAPSATTWRVAEVAFFRENRRVEVGGPYQFTSAWMPAGTGEEWVYVDLGAACTFDRVALSWIRRPAEGALQTSDAAATWTTVEALPAADDFTLAKPVKARYVRVLLTKPASPEGYILSELEVYGRGGPVARPKPASGLSGGAWRIQRDSLVTASGETLSQPGFQDQDWLVATVPATVLSSYRNAGALPDPNFGDNQLAISDSFFYADFWYRNEFAVPPLASGRHVWLNFDGINWKAEVYLNGEKIGRIEGGFMRGRFDVTGYLRSGAKNALAVRVEKNATPGSVKEKTFESPGLNGGALGADNPTYHASIGWDWIPTIRGRNTGIWAGVELDFTGPVTIESPFVTTTTSGDVTIEATLRNHEARPWTGTFSGRFGNVPFETPVTLDPSSQKTITQSLHVPNPKLWWPAGYGDANLYDVLLLSRDRRGAVSDTKRFHAGIRQFTYTEDGGALKIFINGRRFIARGGNWGFPESMLRYRAREYDVAVRYHRDMHFTMIRNWVGQTGDDAFYDACDRYGIVVWQDFWLANPVDGPNPEDNDMFLRNVRDTLLRIRNHPAMGLYCGRNEGSPPPPLEDGIRKLLAELHPDIRYISSSSQGLVSGGGPYRAMPLKSYFDRAMLKLHSEMGMPNIPTIESLKLMMPEAAMWPQGDVWGIHDFSLNGAQGGAAFRSRIDTAYGGATNAADWVTLAQFVNYEGYRAMFEAQSKNRMGLLIWMSHPCWPSFVWQTYDYYFEPTAAYFGAKKASEPLHIQWNPSADTIEVVNYSGGEARGLTARVEILNLDGSPRWEKTATVDSAEDSTVSPIKMEYPSGLTAVHFIRLKLTRGSDTVSENFYWRGVEDGNYRAVRDLPKVRVESTTRAERQGARWLLTTELHNLSAQPALMVRLKAVRERTGDRILPALYSDNYVALMPGERRTIRTELADADTRGENPRMVVEGFNLE